MKASFLRNKKARSPIETWRPIKWTTNKLPLVAIRRNREIQKLVLAARKAHREGKAAVALQLHNRVQDLETKREANDPNEMVQEMEQSIKDSTKFPSRRLLKAAITTLKSSAKDTTH